MWNCQSDRGTRTFQQSKHEQGIRKLDNQQLRLGNQRANDIVPSDWKSDRLARVAKSENNAHHRVDFSSLTFPRLAPVQTFHTTNAPGEQWAKPSPSGNDNLQEGNPRPEQDLNVQNTHTQQVRLMHSFISIPPVWENL